MKGKILIVDDDPDILEAIGLTLTDAGYDVSSSPKGETVEKLGTNGFAVPQLLILDILLSGKDGRVICRQLRKKQKTRHLPVLMISAYPSARESALNAGADEFLAKPFSVDRLLTLVAKFVSVKSHGIN